MVTTGLIIRVKSISSGRKGPGIFQPLRNVSVLLRKVTVYSETSGVISRIAPIIILPALLVASLMVPVAGFEPLLSFRGDFILFAYLIALGRFMMIITAFDSGSSFEGMGASREALYGMLIEPALFVLIAGLTVFTGQFSLSSIFNLSQNEGYSLVFGLIVAYIIGNITLVENSRIPVDDPKTHLELTMIHEVMVLDTSGFNLAMIQLTSMLKFAIFGSLVASAVIPRDLPPAVSIALYFAIQVLFSAAIGFSESFRTRFKMNRNQQYILTVTLISVLFFVVILFTKKIF
ncbi:MAG TPA: NADH-quinone oxidoreductase subunit H, partial [Bacteroidales bacterium]|nr:NADH-quinone oxidoreductase subunit H [Bacteroidales bacterium]